MTLHKLRGRFIGFAAILMLSLGMFTISAPVSSAYSSTFYPTWPTPGSYIYCRDSSFPSAWASATTSAVDNWNNVGSWSKPSFSLVTCTKNSVQVKFTAGSLDDNLCGVTSGLSSLNLRTIKLSSSTSKYGTDPGQGKPCLLQWALRHEFGHALGLKHSCNTSAIMYYKSNSSSTLIQDDKNAHRWAYTSWTGPPSPDPVQC